MTSRLYFAAGFTAAAAALVTVYLLQYVGGLEPCSLCIFQRVAMAGFALFCLIGWIHGPAGLGRRIYAGLAGLTALTGAAIAARHVWLMHLPPDQVPSCGPGLNYLIQIMPLQQVVSTVLRGDANCATVKGSFAGLSLPAWSLIYFILLFGGALAGLFGPGAQASKKRPTSS